MPADRRELGRRPFHRHRRDFAGGRLIAKDAERVASKPRKE